MPIQPTYDDVNLVLRLFELRREERMRKARDWFAFAFKPLASLEDFLAQYPMGSDANASFRMVISYWDMATSFVASGVLNEELFFEDCHECLAVWLKVRDLVPLMRAAFKNPLIAKNLEAVGNRYIEWLNRQAPEALAGMVAMMRGAAVQGQGS